MTSTAHSPAKQVKDAIDQSRAAEAPPSELSATFKSILAPLASLKITIVLFVLSLFLILAGTLAQVDYGIWTVMETYFRTWVAHIELQIFMPNEWAKDMGLLTEKGATTLPFPGGYPLGFAMVINLVAAHAIRFKLIAHGQRLTYGLIGSVIGLTIMFFAVLASTKIIWPLKAPIQFGPAITLSLVALGVLIYPSHLLYGKRLGIVLMHVGVILLLVNELVTGLGAYEGRMEIQQQGINNFTYNLEESELAIIALNPDGSERVVAIPESKLDWSASGGHVISDERLPFDVKVEKFYKNSRLVRAVKEDGSPAQENFADAGELRRVYIAEPVKVGTGADGAGVADIGSGYVTLIDKTTKQKMGTYLFSSFFTHQIGAEEMEPVTVAGKTYQVNMRFAREYKPYSVYLVEFRHDKFTGTQKARNFSSEVLLIDEDHPQGRASKISMNDPLRYRGETFFQAAFLPRDSGTILQVVRNPGYLIPYIACIIVSLGMALHFLGHLDRFSKRLFQ